MKVCGVKFCCIKPRSCDPLSADPSLTVNPSEIPVEIIRPPQDAYEAPGTDVVFEVELNKDRVEVKWLRNNMPVVQGDKHQMMSEGKVHRLQVCEIRPRDQGEYRIIAKDKDAKAKLELAGRNPNLRQHKV